jgi:hypothetical protein
MRSNEVGAVGTPRGTTVAEFEYEPIPIAVIAATRISTLTPAVNPGTLPDVVELVVFSVAMVHVVPPSVVTSMR